MAAKDAFALNEKELRKSLKGNVVGNLYLFYGVEEYLIRNYCELIEKIILTNDFKLLNKVVLNEKVTSSQIIDNCLTAPVFSDRRLVIVKNSGMFKGKKKAENEDKAGEDTEKSAVRSSKKRKSGDELADFLREMPEHVCLIFIEPEIDKRLKYVNIIDKIGLVVEFDYERPDKLARWVIRKLKEMGHDTDPLTAAMIVDYCEPGMDEIMNELTKLCAYAGERTVITVDDVKLVCTRSVKSRIFDLTDAIAAKRSSAALSVLNDMTALREPMQKVMYMIARQFRQLVQIKLMVMDGARKGEVAAQFKVPPFIAEKLMKQAHSFEIDILEKAVSTGLELDLAVKSGRLEDRAAVELMIIGLAAK